MQLGLITPRREPSFPRAPASRGEGGAELRAASGFPVTWTFSRGPFHGKHPVGKPGFLPLPSLPGAGFRAGFSGSVGPAGAPQGLLRGSDASGSVQGSPGAWPCIILSLAVGTSRCWHPELLPPRTHGRTGWALPPRSLRLVAASQRAPGARQHPGAPLGSPCSPRAGDRARLPDLAGSAGGAGGRLGDR